MLTARCSLRKSSHPSLRRSFPRSGRVCAIQSFAALGALAGAALSLTAPRAFGADLYSCTINQPTSAVTYTFTVSIPFTGTLVGENDPLKPLGERTRTKNPSSFFSCGTFGATQNDPRNISGSIAASGNNTGAGATPIRPTGTFQFAINTTTNIATVRSLSTVLLASGPINAAGSINNFTYQSFCTINPACSAPFIFPITLPLGTISVTQLNLTQLPGDATGPLTSTGTNVWQFSVPMVVTATSTAAFGTTPLPIDPQDIPIVFQGTVTRNGTTISVSASTQIAISPPVNPTPTVLPPTALAVPADSTLCPNINVVLSLTTQNQVVTNTNTLALVAPGTRVPCRPDINDDGVISVQDIFDFLFFWFANDPRADINGGGVTAQDIFDFLALWFSPPLGC